VRCNGQIKNVVFVDDERKSLDSWRARLYKHRNDWSMTFVESGKEAIAIFEQRRVDLIVSDVRMPGMDGGQLLRHVKQRWPSTTRILISSYPESVHAVKLTSLAHQYVARPCDDGHLENIVERCLNVQELLSQESLRQVVGRIGRLPAVPKTYARLQAALAQPTVTAAQISDIVSASPAIVSKVLQITNSAFFRLPKRMVRIKDAVTYLGFETIRNLVLSAEIFSDWKTPKDLRKVDPDHIQKHAQHAAAACKALAAGPVSPDDAWLAGLLHDIGYWILIEECPRELAQAIELSRTQGLSLFECERRTVGASHAEVGAYLLGLWGVPLPIVEAVAHHHTPRAIVTDGYDLLGALAVSHALLEPATAHAVPASTGLGVEAGYLETVSAPFDWDEAERRVRSIGLPN
jgi:putative nucleotidyltransferase with HDIG domain